MAFRPKFIASVAGLGLLLVAIWWLNRSGPSTPAAVQPPSPAAQAKAPVKPVGELAPVTRPASAEELSGVSHIADDLNSPGGTIRRDLEILNEVFATWQTNFPREGNPVGENAEITAALTGANAVRFGFIPPGHRAINPRGELCDRWGTPFRFHQLSGSQMEIRSAGPDRKFGTADDMDFAPAAPVPVPR